LSTIGQSLDSLQQTVDEACAEIDRLRASNRELVAALEQATTYLYELWGKSAAMPAAEADVYEAMRGRLRKREVANEYVRARHQAV